ncbi:DUF3024 domain-containing protein [Amycolatopsis taiwanensis]|nr:DUF3024 domain-containing protein [Amycolatopsis taiwanensis]
MSPIPELQQRQIDRWCERRVPASKRGELTVMSRWRGRMVTLVEKRAEPPDGGGPAQVTEHAFAQLRYGTDGLWTLYYWVDGLARWRQYPASLPENSPVPLLQDIDRSTDDGYFHTWLSAR